MGLVGCLFRVFRALLSGFQTGLIESFWVSQKSYTWFVKFLVPASGSDAIISLAQLAVLSLDRRTTYFRRFHNPT